MCVRTRSPCVLKYAAIRLFTGRSPCVLKYAICVNVCAVCKRLPMCGDLEGRGLCKSPVKRILGALRRVWVDAVDAASAYCTVRTGIARRAVYAH